MATKICEKIANMYEKIVNISENITKIYEHIATISEKIANIYRGHAGVTVGGHSESALAVPCRGAVHSHGIMLNPGLM